MMDFYIKNRLIRILYIKNTNYDGLLYKEY
jgi:hypothetical protein